MAIQFNSSFFIIRPDIRPVSILYDLVSPEVTAGVKKYGKKACPGPRQLCRVPGHCLGGGHFGRRPIGYG
ncbi:hypothetical protein HMPREF0322_03867 [Desulfitobacterium hafniense DP7]|uniref:Uncharacterized protein n=1 Tax=Desulfitobacterium hafniense DP7 TaxID=537010 RepID=G9XSB7_DESHA|nr:hypothetical protein HMPREF0322_03867 [Desulfitobacterium hafniense DP7]